MSFVKINLLPPEIKKKRLAEKGLILLFGVLVAVIGFSVVLTLILFMKAGSEQKILASKKARITVIDKEIAKYNIYKKRQEEIKAHKTALDEVIKNEVFWHRFVNEMSMIVPDDITLGSLKLNEDGTVELEGSCYDYDTVAEYLVRLNDLSLIKNVWLLRTETTELDKVEIVGETSSESGGTEEDMVLGVKFSISAKLKNPVIDTQANATGSTQGSTSSQSTSSSQGGNQ